MTDSSIPTYSHSQLGTWERCHFSWSLNYIEKYVTIETKSYFVGGSVVHDLLMTYYKNLPLTDHDSCVTLVKQRVGEYHRACGSDPDKLKIVTNMARVVKGYLEDFARDEDAKWDFLDAEKYFKVLLKSPKGRQFYFEGYIDILAREKATGRIYLWDHKTVGQASSFWTENMLLMDSQTPTYEAVLFAQNIPVFGSIINQLNKYSYKTPATEEQLYRRRPIFHSESELRIRLHELGRTVDEIEDAKELGLYRRSLSKDCSGCFYMDPCLTLMKAPELPLEHVMRVDFVKKTEKKALI